MQRLEGKVVAITGASSGIGRGMAERFASEGAAVVLGARTAEPLEAVASAIQRRGGRALALNNVEPTLVSRQHRILRVKMPQNLIDHRPRAARARQPIEHPGAIREPLNQSRLGQKLQVTRDARLALVQDTTKLEHRKLFPRQ